MKKTLSLLIITGFTLFSCEEVVDLDIDQSTPQIVIEGLLSNKDTVQYVKVSRSIQFYDTGNNPITNAIVKVNSEGNEFTYSHNPDNSEEYEGYYFSDAPYSGEIGKAYTLTVDVSGVEYVATDTMKYVTEIDSLEIVIAPNPSDDDKELGRIYQVLLYATEPQETEDFYLFHFYRNDSLITSSTNIYAFSDTALGDKLDGLPSPELFKEGELAGVTIYSLSKEEYIYYTDLSNILNSDGGMFSPPPANPRNTFSNGALGLWQVSAIREAAIKIEP